MKRRKFSHDIKIIHTICIHKIVNNIYLYMYIILKTQMEDIKIYLTNKIKTTNKVYIYCARGYAAYIYIAAHFRECISEWETQKG